MMADYNTLFLLFLQITVLHSAPLQIPMQDIQMMPLANQISLQQQIMALQQLQEIQNLKTVHSPSTLYLPQPMIIMLPISEEQIKDANVNTNIKETTKDKPNTGYVDEDSDSVIVEAENTELSTNTEEMVLMQPKRALIVLPNGRLGIGTVISAIPWLPFEVNVPDTIAWAYNGISNGIAGIISIIGGQRNPFRPKPQTDMMKPESSVKLFLKNLQMKNQNTPPIIIMPEMMSVSNLVPIGMMLPAARSDMWENRVGLQGK